MPEISREIRRPDEHTVHTFDPRNRIDRIGARVSTCTSTAISSFARCR